jgi:transketolase
MEFNRINIRTWSMLGERRTFGTVLDAYASEMDKLFVMSGDLASSSGLDRFIKNHPEKFLSAGIAEQNMVGVASGLAANGYKPFITSFSPFMTGRCYDQIRMHLGYMHHDVKLVGLAAGIGVGIQGNSHYGLDDVALMRAIPGMTIVEPADCTEVAKAVKAIYDYDGPVYLRLIGEAGSPIVYKADYEFEIGKSITLRDGDEVAFVSAGTMVHHTLRAADLLAQNGIESRVLNMHTIKPLDVNALDNLKSFKLVVVAEEANVIGGLGSAVAEYAASLGDFPPVYILGINDEFPHAGSYKYMLAQAGLDAEHIADKVMARLHLAR